MGVGGLSNCFHLNFFNQLWTGTLYKPATPIKAKCSHFSGCKSALQQCREDGKEKENLPSTSLHISLTLIPNLPRKCTCHICLVTVNSLHHTCHKCGICNAQMTYHQRMCCLRTWESYDIVGSVFLGKHRPPAPPRCARFTVVPTRVSEQCFSSFGGH